MTCSKCEAGYFLPTEKASSRLQCRKCVPGTRSGEGAGGCFLCPPGQYGDQEAMAECFMCPPGTFNPSAAWGGRATIRVGSFLSNKKIDSLKLLGLLTELMLSY